jgi:hypothetical protein
MGVQTSELKPGDRVVLNCPHARITAKRDAIFEGIFGFEDAIKRLMADLVADPSRSIDLSHVSQELRDASFAVFLFSTFPAGAVVREVKRDQRGEPFTLPSPVEQRMLLRVLPGGRLMDEEHRPVYVESVTRMGFG